MNNIRFLFGCVCLVLIAACASGAATAGVRGMPAAQANAQASMQASSATAPASVDAKRATNLFTKKCEMRPGATRQDLDACLERDVARLENKPLPDSFVPPAGYTRALGEPLEGCVRGNPGASEEDYTNCLIARQHDLQKSKNKEDAQKAAKKEETEAASSEDVIVSSEPTYYIPTATGGVCTTNPQYVLTVTNNKVGMGVTVAGSLASSLTAFHCDAPVNLTIMPVKKKSGQEGFVRALLPEKTAKFVFLVNNGGLGDIKVTFTTYLLTPTAYGQTQVASPEISAKEISYKVPYHDIHQVIDDSIL